VTSTTQKTNCHLLYRGGTGKTLDLLTHGVISVGRFINKPTSLVKL